MKYPSKKAMENELQSNPLSLAFVEALYENYLRDPDSVDETWRRYFADQTQEVQGDAEDVKTFRTRPRFTPRPLFGNGGPVRSRNGNGATSLSAEVDAASLQHKVDLLIRNYRVRGHRRARIDPLGRKKLVMRELTPEYYGLTDDHMHLRFATEFLAGGGTPTLEDIIHSAQQTYCRYIGCQFMHIDSIAVREWLQSRMERSENRIKLSRKEQLRILTRLTDAVMLEEFIQKKFLGAKSFSLEGAETLIPLLDFAIERSGEHGVEEVIIGMPHRGRLNVLANIMGKNPRNIFQEFQDNVPELNVGRGDVKYHLGYHSNWITETGKKVHLALTFNPSHLEYVNSVALGRMRAKNDRDDDPRGDKGLVVLIHGDAAFAGEGIVQETLNLSQLEAYTTGGTIHIIVNNQIGFTTTPNQARSSTYASDIARMLQSPIFHVNGEDPESVAQVVNLAIAFRTEYRRDVVIDMYCYRRRGHNEGDEPNFTQPLMYQKIRERESVRETYLRRLLRLGGIMEQEAQLIEEKRRQHLEDELSAARKHSRRIKYEADKPIRSRMAGPETTLTTPQNEMFGMWTRYVGGPEIYVPDVETRISRERIVSLLERLTDTPESFKVHPKLQRVLEQRRSMATDEKPLDWAAGEALALASLATEGVRVRLTGQDSERGTFSHRHSVLHDYETGELYRLFQHLDPEQAPVEIHNSPLSEASVLGFEYGYSVGCPDGLVMWEAQFGDFVNVAQVIIDQFITTAEDKWRRLNGLVMLLPHGLEGTGPEHASARLERFLQLAAEDNMQIVFPTTPAQIFHCIRRQVLRPWRKPLIVMSPKSMLRNPRAVSRLEELSEGAFQRIITDPDIDPKKTTRIILCTGKIYYDLIQRREELEHDDVAIIRVEQLYPLENKLVSSVLAPYKDGTPVFWVQEEPENMGAWRYMLSKFRDSIDHRLPFSGIYRPPSASPATGSASSHRLEHIQLMAEAFGLAVSVRRPVA